MNCKNSAQNALKVAIFRHKIEKKFLEGQVPLHRPLPIGEGIPPFQLNSTPSAPRYSRLRRFGASILAPSALDLAPPPVRKSWIHH